MAVPLRNDLCIDSSERRVLDLAKYGVSCVPVLGATRFHHKAEDVKEHVHEGCLEITYCKRGQLAFESEGRVYPFLPGSVFVSRPDQPHRMRENPQGTRTNYLLFRLPKRGQTVLNLPTRESKYLVERLLALPSRLFQGNARIEADFQRLFDICDSDDAGVFRSLNLSCVVLDLLLNVIACSANASVTFSGDALRPLIDDMREQPWRKWPIGELTRRTGLSPSTLRTRFKALTGLSPHGYLVSCRIQRAKKELTHGGASIADVALSLGFASPRHFSTAFKLATGFSPRQWAQAHS
ncbi:MAG: helix-turn-helix transcriptional regulator [Kiritimatiellae bacterium]|nr:helix-turn-helix transcriptional regulator [Kiritimatiellia bacterium]